MQDPDVIQQAKEHMKAALDHFDKELRALQAGRANTALVENIHAECYGSQMRIKELATLTTPEPRQLLITPFDAHNTAVIAKAIEKANLGLRVSAEGKIIRVFFPELDEARRKDLVVQVHKKLEECKIAVRAARRDANEHVKAMKEELPEDDLKRLEKQVQELTDKYCKNAEEHAHDKEKEVMTV